MKRFHFFVLLVAGILALPGSACAGDVAVTLDTTDGSSAFQIYDGESNELARIRSDGVVDLKGHAITNAAYAGDGGGLTNVTATTYAETDPLWSAVSNAVRIQLDTKVPRTVYDPATNNLWGAMGAETTARVDGDAAFATNVEARLASNVWAAADSTTNYVRRTGDALAGALDMQGHPVTNAAYFGDGAGLSNVTAAAYAETDPVWSNDSVLVQAQINGKVNQADYVIATNSLWNAVDLETNDRAAADAAFAAADAAFATNVEARLASNVWAAADSTTNYVRRTGDTTSGPLTNTGPFTITGTNLSLGVGSSTNDNYLFLDNHGEYMMWDNSATRFAFSDGLSADGPLWIYSSASISTSAPAYSMLGNSTPDHADISSYNDLLIGGSLELNGDLYFDGNILYMGGTATNDDETIRWDDDSGLVKTYWDDSEGCFKVDGAGMAIEGPIYVGYIVNGNTNFNAFSTVRAEPDSDRMDSWSDVYIGGDLEVNGYTYFGNRAYMGVSEMDQYLYFYDGTNFNGQYLEWQQSGNKFIFSTNVYVDGNLQVSGTLSKGGGSFKIDHPLDPANQYLYHSFVESPDMKNVYDGVAVLDANGEATVAMPAWFDALNRDFRYQLTPIGAAAPDLHVSAEMSGNQFSIAGGAPGLKVSWQVTGIRQDPFANAYRIPVEQDKPEGEKGTYLYPELYR